VQQNGMQMLHGHDEWLLDSQLAHTSMKRAPGAKGDDTAAAAAAAAAHLVFEVWVAADRQEIRRLPHLGASAQQWQHLQRSMQAVACHVLWGGSSILCLLHARHD
jgi:hypothetical protein